MSRTHRFFLEPLDPPNDWRGHDDPRAPRLIFRGLTVGESQRNLSLDDPKATIFDLVGGVSACVLRFEGEWGLYLGSVGAAPPTAEILRHILQEDLLAFVRAVGEVSTPKKAEDRDPLASGRGL